MSQVYEQKCPRCGAAMRFDAETGKLICDYCDNIVDIEAEDQKQETVYKDDEIKGFDFKKLTDQASRPDTENLPVYICVSCGAEVIASPVQTATACPYCGNNIVLTDKVSGMLRPDKVIPFHISSKELPAAVKRFYKDKKLLPKDFFSESKMGNVTGVYIPFWVFNGKFSGDLDYFAEKVTTTRRGDYLYSTEDHYVLVRRAQIAFDNIPVDAGEKIDNALMDSLEPFNLEEAKPFDMGYLAGFTAERFDEKKSTMSDRARKRMLNTARDMIASRAGGGYSNVRYQSGYLNADIDASYMLFPVYLFDIKYGNKNYNFAVNGQTGKVVGRLPDSKNARVSYFYKWFGIVAGILIALSILKYFLGW